MKVRDGILLIAIAPIFILLTSCSVLVPEHDDAATGLLPGHFSTGDGGLDLGSRWWEEFESDELDQLVERALAGNLNISQAGARLVQASALARQRGSSRWPSVVLEGSGSISERENPTVEGGDTRTESYELGVAATYEVDLWGRVRSTTKSAEADRMATLEDLRVAELSVAAETTLRYLELMNVRAKRDLVEHQLETSKQIEELIELRFRRSQTGALDVLQQRQNVAAIETILPPLKAREELLQHELATLVGVPLDTELGLTRRTLPSLPSMLDPGLPSELLARRPDVRASYQRLQSADWAVGAARADRLPALRLTASGGYTSDAVEDLFDNWIARLIGGLAGPILDGGRRRAEVRRTQALSDERVAAYRATVLNAVKEVEDALVLDRRQEEFHAALGRQHEAARLSYDEAVSRYRKGAASYLSALVSLNSVQRVERELIDSSFDQAVYRVRLCRALAGSWREGDSE